MAVPLSLRSLDALPGVVQRPRYGRETLQAGILHIGVGNFHRAHQAVYLDDLFNQGRHRDWAIVGASTRPQDEAIHHALSAQDWLTTVVERSPGTDQARITGAMIDFVPVKRGGRGLVERLDDQDIRIVSLTITEGGYCLDPATGRVDPEHPDILRDVQALENPNGVFGVLVAALRRRRDKGIAPFTVMSCDNIPGNGHVAQDAAAGLAAHVDQGLADWIRAEVAFPNSMVDRITPVTTDRDRSRVEEQFGIEDRWPVVCEPYRQWVLEDRFTAGRPPLEEVGVTFTDDVAAFELMKIRILNGGHAAIAYPAALLGISFVHEAMADPQVRGFLDRLETEEIVPTVPDVPGVDLQAYFRLVADRFGNPAVGDTIDRLCVDGSNRQPKFILPTARDRVERGLPVRGLSLVSALWCRYCAGLTDADARIIVQDENASRLTQAALAARDHPDAFLALRNIFGDLGDMPAFRDAFAEALRKLWHKGTRPVLQDYIEHG